MFEDYFYLGKITKKNGLKGELVVYLDTDEPERYYSMESVFFDLGGEPIPFFVKEIKIKNNNQLIVLFQNIDNDSSLQYVNTDLYLPLSVLPKLSGNKFYYHEIKGFIVIDENKGNIGVCNDVLDYTHQAIMQIFSDKGEILIPIVDDFIKNIDREKCYIEIISPPGLIDLYIGE
jgi:16S rRNA processing protein RimM